MANLRCKIWSGFEKYSSYRSNIFFSAVFVYDVEWMIVFIPFVNMVFFFSFFRPIKKSINFLQIYRTNIDIQQEFCQLLFFNFLGLYFVFIFSCLWINNSPRFKCYIDTVGLCKTGPLRKTLSNFCKDEFIIHIFLLLWRLKKNRLTWFGIFSWISFFFF